MEALWYWTRAATLITQIKHSVNVVKNECIHFSCYLDFCIYWDVSSRENFSHGIKMTQAFWQIELTRFISLLRWSSQPLVLPSTDFSTLLMENWMSLHREVLWIYMLRNLIWNCEMHFYLGKYKFCFRSGFSIRHIILHNLASLYIIKYYKVIFHRVLTKWSCALIFFRSRCNKSIHLQLDWNIYLDVLHPVTFRTYTEVSLFRSRTISAVFTSLWRHIISNN